MDREELANISTSKRAEDQPAADLHEVSLRQVLAHERRKLQHVELCHGEDGLERTIRFDDAPLVQPAPEEFRKSC